MEKKVGRGNIFSAVVHMNAGRKRDEAVALLKLFFPRLESHLGQMKKYQATIDYLKQKNKGLKSKDKDESSIKKQLEAARLKQENEQLRRFVDNIPPELLRDLRGQGGRSIQKTSSSNAALYLEN